MPFVAGLGVCISIAAQQAPGQEAATLDPLLAESVDPIRRSFQQEIHPLLRQFCVTCHDAEKMKSGIRVDWLNGELDDPQLRLWRDIRKQVGEELMPPEDEPQPTSEQRQRLLAWIDAALDAARNRHQEKNGSMRRLTLAQYRNTLRDLLALEDDLTDILPPDAVSEEGFVNNGRTLGLSPLLVETYFKIAEQALDLCIVDETVRPSIQNFRVDFGTGVNSEPCADKLDIGANNHLLKNQDFRVTQLQPVKPFAFEPFWMRTKYRFIEGYQGNDTVRGWREFDSLYHAVFACMRGTEGYPKGRAYDVIPEGLALRPAIPSPELFDVSSTYGPNANFKIALRELPEQGRFRVTVKAAKYDDGLLLDPGSPLQTSCDAVVVFEPAGASSPASIDIPQAGIYQVDIYLEPGEKSETLSLTVGTRSFSGGLTLSHELGMAFMLVRLPAGNHSLILRYDTGKLRRVVFTRLDEAGELAQRFRVFERRAPRLGVHLGLRRDCGSTLKRVGEVQTVASLEWKDFVFEGAIRNFPSPDEEKDNVNYLAGLREIGVRSEYTDGRDMPRLVVRSVEFEGPFYESWPPETHRRIFIESDQRDDPRSYAREVITSFATRAFRRPLTEQEAASLNSVGDRSFADSGDIRRAVKDALLVALTSPQFLFLTENSRGPEAEPLDGYELASKLSYFLWNAPPDAQLLQLASRGELHRALDVEVPRMIQDPRFGQFTREFVSQWLSLEKLDVVEVDRERFPKLTREVKAQLRQEPVEFLQYLFRQNLPLRNLIESDFVMANEVVAGYYGLADRTESGFEFLPVVHGDQHLGGVLTQAGILAGLSNGRESNPVKRGAWLARKIIAEPPDDPPPNVPALPDDDGGALTLREKLERHRRQPGCAKCHAGIDPWGLPLEQFDAAGLRKQIPDGVARSTLPDKTSIPDANGLKSYLVNQRGDQVAFSFLKHLATYAVGRNLTYNEIEWLQEKGLEFKADGYRMQDLLRFVIDSELFIEK